MVLPYHSFISWDLGPITIQSWGVMAALGFLATLFIAVKEVERKRLSKEAIYDLVFWCIIIALIGSRIPYVIFNWSEFSGNILEIFKIWKGGLMFFGGFGLAFLFSVVYVKIKKLDFWKYADVAGLSIPIGHAIGRIGCILGDGGHIGKITTMPFGVLINGEVRHLTALYSAVYLFLIFLILFWLRKKRVFDGFIFSLYLILYGIARFLMEFTRESILYLGLDIAQWVCIGLVLIGIGMIYYKMKGKKDELF